MKGIIKAALKQGMKDRRDFLVVIDTPDGLGFYYADKPDIKSVVISVVKHPYESLLEIYQTESDFYECIYDHRGYKSPQLDLQEMECKHIFNTMGYKF